MVGSDGVDDGANVFISMWSQKIRNRRIFCPKRRCTRSRRNPSPPQLRVSSTDSTTRDRELLSWFYRRDSLPVLPSEEIGFDSTIP